MSGARGGAGRHARSLGQHLAGCTVRIVYRVVTPRVAAFGFQAMPGSIAGSAGTSSNPHTTRGVPPLVRSSDASGSTPGAGTHGRGGGLFSEVFRRPSGLGFGARVTILACVIC